MAQRVEIILIDDIDETPANEKVRFGLDGINYEIDSSKENAAALRDALAPYVGAGRRIKDSAPAPPELLRGSRRRRSAPGLPRTAMK